MAAITSTRSASLGADLQLRMSKLVKMLMARDGLNQQQLGERLGMDQTTVSARLRGVSRWTVEDLTRLSMTFGVHPGEFWTDPKDFTPGISSGIAPPRKPRSRRRTVASFLRYVPGGVAVAA